MHLKRNKTPKLWPIERKGTKYVIRPLQSVKDGIPLLIAIRDILKFSDTRRDVKNMIKMGAIKVNHKIVKDEKYPISVSDILGLDEKSFKLVIQNKKFNLKEITGKESNEKIDKVIGKKILNNGVQQINLYSGRNYIAKGKINTGDSVVIDLKKNEIIEIMSMKEKAKIVLISGKHIGEEGEIEKIEGDSGIIKTKEGKINVKLENVMVVK